MGGQKLERRISSGFLNSCLKPHGNGGYFVICDEIRYLQKIFKRKKKKIFLWCFVDFKFSSRMKIFDIKVPLHLGERFTDLRWLEETFRGEKKKRQAKED